MIIPIFKTVVLFEKAHIQCTITKKNNNTSLPPTFKNPTIGVAPITQHTRVRNKKIVTFKGGHLKW